MVNSTNSPFVLTERLLIQARNWLGENEWQDMDAGDFAALDAAAVERGIQRHYHGGVEQFIVDGCECPLCDGFKPAGLRCCDECREAIGACHNGKAVR